MEGFGYDPMGDSSNASVAPQRGSSKLARDKVPGPRSPNEKALWASVTAHRLTFVGSFFEPKRIHIGMPPTPRRYGRFRASVGIQRVFVHLQLVGRDPVVQTKIC